MKLCDNSLGRYAFRATGRGLRVFCDPEHEGGWAADRTHGEKWEGLDRSDQQRGLCWYQN